MTAPVADRVAAAYEAAATAAAVALAATKADFVLVPPQPAGPEQEGRA